jgi:hypothetical protein
MKHLEQIVATYVYSHCNKCNVPIYFCNIHMNTYNIPLEYPKHFILLQHVMHDTLVGGDHHVSCVEELDSRLDGQIRAGKWRSEEHHGLGRRELLPLGHRGTRSLEAGAKYDTTAAPSPSPVPPQEEVTRRTLAPAPVMRVGAGCRRDFNGGA